MTSLAAAVALPWSLSTSLASRSRQKRLVRGAAGLSRSTELWLKALVPHNKSRKPAIQALIAHLKQQMQPVPPWDREAPSARSTAEPMDRDERKHMS